VTAQLVYREAEGGTVFNYAHLKYRLPGRYSFAVQNGLHLRMRLKVEARDDAEPAKRLQLQASLEADMMVDAKGEPKGDPLPVRPNEPSIAPVPATPVTASSLASPGLPGPAVESGGPAANPPGRPQKKRLRKHLKNLLQNLAQSAREDDAQVRLQSLHQKLTKQTREEESSAELSTGAWTEEVEGVTEGGSTGPGSEARKSEPLSREKEVQPAKEGLRKAGRSSRSKPSG